MDTATLRQLRVLRAEWFLTAVTRFGAARIPEYSRTQEEDAAVLHREVLRAISLLDEAQAEAREDPNLFEVARADLAMGVLRVAHYALEPALESARGRIQSFIAQPSADTALRAARRLFEDKLYADAYRRSCTEVMDYVISGDKPKELEKRLEKASDKLRQHLLTQCDRLAKLAQLNSCPRPKDGEAKSDKAEGQPQGTKDSATPNSKVGETKSDKTDR